MSLSSVMVPCVWLVRSRCAHCASASIGLVMKGTPNNRSNSYKTKPDISLIFPSLKPKCGETGVHKLWDKVLVLLLVFPEMLMSLHFAFPTCAKPNQSLPVLPASFGRWSMQPNAPPDRPLSVAGHSHSPVAAGAPTAPPGDKSLKVQFNTIQESN